MEEQKLFQSELLNSDQDLNQSWDDLQSIQSSQLQIQTTDISYTRLNGNRSPVQLSLPSLEMTLKNLSELIIQLQGLPDDWICAFYSQDGYPLTGTLSQMSQVLCSDVIPAKARLNLFTVPNFDKKSLQAQDPNQGPNQLQLKSEQDASVQFSVRVNFGQTTVQQLIQKVFSLTGIPTYEIRLKKSDSFLSQKNQVLSYYEFGENDIVFYKKKVYESKIYSYKPKLKQSVQQTLTGQRTLHSMLHTISKTLSFSEIPTKQAFFAGVRKASNNCTPLVQSLCQLTSGKPMSLLNSIALQQGFILMNKTILKQVFSLQIQQKKLLQYTLGVSALISTIFTKPAIQDSRQQTFQQTDIVQPLTYSVIKTPVYLRKIDGDYTYYDYDILSSKFQQSELLPNLPKISLNTLKINHEFKLLIKRCQLNFKNSLFCWQGSYQSSPSFLDLLHQFYPQGLQWNRAEDLQKDFKFTRIMAPLQLKNPQNKDCLTRDKNRDLKVIFGLNAKVPNKVDLQNILTRAVSSHDIDDLASAIEMVWAQGDQISLSREPFQAIVVVFDHSGSMGQRFENDQDYSRIDATKQFFQNFADRTVGYNYQHVMSLLLFGSTIKRACNFTENLSTFAIHVQKTTHQGQTKLWDTLSTACDMLESFSADHPECVLRILALSDGQDNMSQKTHFQVCKRMIQSKITLDSVVVGQLCNKLKAISFATGGYVFLPSSIQAGIKLFESQTFLSWRIRESPPAKQINSETDLVPFMNKPHSKTGPQMRAPQEIKARIDLPTNIIQKAQQAPPKFQNKNSAGKFRRILKQLEQLTKNPHPNAQIYPVADDPSFWNIYMQGPDQTPYQNGLFHLYAQFKQDYPFKSPNVRFITPIYHCNINQNGLICHSIFDQFWSPAVTMKKVIDCIYGLLMTPEPQDPLDANIAAQYLHDYETYVVNATLHTRQHASLSIQQLTQQTKVPSQNIRQIPSYFLDPITNQLMENPVICLKSNKCYQRAEIVKVIQSTGREPETGVEISEADLVPNIPLVQAIQEFKKSLIS